VPPTPELGKTGVVSPVSGTVSVRVPGASNFVPLTAARAVPVGTEVNTDNGRVDLTVAVLGGKTEHSNFYDGRFLFNQRGPKAAIWGFVLYGRKPITILGLSDPLTCGNPSGKTAAQVSRKKKRHLWGSAKGTFRTRGKNSSATVRGTIWFTQDDCTSTLVHVKRGVVDVFDFALRKHVSVKAGQTYVAHAP
jgi:hypothetical protein